MVTQRRKTILHRKLNLVVRLNLIGHEVERRQLVFKSTRLHFTSLSVRSRNAWKYLGKPKFSATANADRSDKV